MRPVFLVVLVVLLASCSRPPRPAEPPPVLGAIALPAADAKLPPHPDADLKFDEFVAKHFPDLVRQLNEIDTRMVELAHLAKLTRADRNNPNRWKDAQVFDDERQRLGIDHRRQVNDALYQGVLSLKEKMRNR